MHIISYIVILVLKIFENGISTLRLIFISDGRKRIGAFLNFAIALVWSISTGMVVTDIKDNPIKLIFFALGCLLGSYFGSVLEEKIALGNNVIVCISNIDISYALRKNGYPVTVTKGNGLNGNKYILYIAIKRKLKNKLIKKIIELDSKSMIISEYANILYGGII